MPNVPIASTGDYNQGKRVKQKQRRLKIPVLHCSQFVATTLPHHESPLPCPAMSLLLHDQLWTDYLHICSGCLARRYSRDLPFCSSLRIAKQA